MDVKILESELRRHIGDLQADVEADQKKKYKSPSKMWSVLS